MGNRSQNRKSLLQKLLLVTVLLFVSCEGFRTAERTVIDDQTGLPIDSAFCSVLTGNQIVMTDETGRFDVQNPIGGCTFGCSDITIEFAKTGYQSQTLSNPEVNVTVRLRK